MEHDKNILKTDLDSWDDTLQNMLLVKLDPCPSSRSKGQKTEKNGQI